MPTTTVSGRGGLLTRGLSLLTGEPSERVTTRSGRLDLLVSAGEFEMIEGFLDVGQRMTLVPPDAPGARVTEVYFVQEGVLALVGRPEVRVGPGDRLIADGLAEPAIFEAIGAVRFLVITSVPFFHQISDTMHQLLDLAREIEIKDGYTADHCLRLQRLSFATGRELGLAPQRLHLLDYGAYLHDLGKVKVPLEILQKPGKLDEREWVVMKRHPVFGREMLATTALAAAGSIVEQHHERGDGSGYPYGLTESEILVEAQIVAVVDTYDAMTTDRPYRKALGPDEAFAELERFAGIHHSREVHRAFLSAVRQVEATERRSATPR